MGTKVEFRTVEDQRKMAHSAVDAFFNKIKANADGTPVDEIRLHHEKEFERTDKDGFIVHGEMFAIATKLKHPLVQPDTGFDIMLQEREAKSPDDLVFAIAHPNVDATNHLVQFLLNELNFGALGDEGYMLDLINAGHPISCPEGVTISDIARRANLSFRPIADCDDLPGSKAAVMQSAGISQKLRDENTETAEEFADNEAEAEQRYKDALARGLSDAEAREEGWPSKPPVEHDIEEDGRHIAEIPSVPGAMAYGSTPEEAETKARAIADAVKSDGPVNDQPPPAGSDPIVSDDKPST